MKDSEKENKKHWSIYGHSLLLVLWLSPIAVLFLWSIAAQWSWPSLWPQHYSLRGWHYFFSGGSQGLATLVKSIGLSLGVTFFALLISLPAAKALAFYEFKGKNWVEKLIFAPLIIPMVSVSMGLHLQFIKMNMANTYWGVGLIQLVPCMPYTIRLLQHVFELTGKQLEEQARVLGASSLQIWMQITWPQILPGLVAASCMAFLISFSQYFLTYLIGGGQVITFTMQMFPYIQSGDRHMGAVYSIIFIGVTWGILRLMTAILTKAYRDQDMWMPLD